jgi:hypothetical protein
VSQSTLPRDTPGERILANPFLVLGLAPAASALEVEREGQKLLGMVELGLEAAASYATPLGPRPRSVELLRWAMAELRDPHRRLLHELWLSSGTEVRVPASSGANAWRGARAAFGWSI